MLPGLDVELVLLAIGVIERSSIPGTQSYVGLQFKHHKEEERERDEQGEEEEGVGGRGSIFKRSEEEEDAELDWDL